MRRLTDWSAARAAILGALALAPAVGPALAQDQGAPTATIAARVQALPQDLSPWTMFMSADIVVKAVMIGLVFASLVTWTVFIAKSIELFRARRSLTGALTRIEGARSLAEARTALEGENNVVAAFLAAALREVQLSAKLPLEGGGLRERAASAFAEISRAEGRRLRTGMGALATIGATAPFVGLFGTVWGIMNSFIGISRAQTTNLAVVAPGIAEALLATAIGLVAAIPAVIIYNHFARGTRSHLELVNRASGAVMRLLSRDIDRGFRAPPLQAVAE